VENYRPGTIDAMGLGYEVLSKRKPGIIVSSVSGYGQHGPLRDRALFDCIAQAASGLMYRNGDSTQEPQLAGMFVADHMAGLYAAFGTVLAVLEQRRSGRGQHVDVALFDSLFSCLGPVVSAELMLGSLMQRTGNRDAFAAPANIFRATDGYVYLHAGTDPLFRRFCKFIGRPELLTDERYANVKQRMQRVHEVEAIVAEWVAARTAAECERLLAEAGVPVSVVADVRQALTNPQIAEREMVVRIPTANGEVRVPGNPVKLSATPVSRYRKPPRIGEDTDDVLVGVLGYSTQALKDLRKSKVV
jgi:crotonobetainyl-CoA:carnitine CoA-transferase CaiB-like acyl-CoA transferase